MGHFGGRMNFHKSHRSHSHSHSHFGSHSSSAFGRSSTSHKSNTFGSSSSSNHKWSSSSSSGSGVGLYSCAEEDPAATGEWSTNIFNCFSIDGCASIIEATFPCKYLLMGALHKVWDPEDGATTTSEQDKCSNCNMGCFMPVIFDLDFCAGSPVFGGMLRTMVRSKFNINESNCSAFTWNFFCPVCALAQLRREMTARGVKIDSMCACCHNNETPPSLEEARPKPTEMGTASSATVINVNDNDGDDDHATAVHHKTTSPSRRFASFDEKQQQQSTSSRPPALPRTSSSSRFPMVDRVRRQVAARRSAEAMVGSREPFGQFAVRVKQHSDDRKVHFDTNCGDGGRVPPPLYARGTAKKDDDYGIKVRLDTDDDDNAATTGERNTTSPSRRFASQPLRSALSSSSSSRFPMVDRVRRQVAARRSAEAMAGSRESFGQFAVRVKQHSDRRRVHFDDNSAAGGRVVPPLDARGMARKGGDDVDVSGNGPMPAFQPVQYPSRNSSRNESRRHVRF